MEEINDVELVARCRSGGVEAWEMLIRRHRDTAWRAALVFAVHFGFTVDDLHSSDGFASFHCNDPDGRVIELFWQAPAHWGPAAPKDRKGDTSV